VVSGRELQGAVVQIAVAENARNILAHGPFGAEARVSSAGRSCFLAREALVFDFWAAVHEDVDAEAKAAFSAQLRFQSRDTRLI
jgi:hypothetical protein